MAEESAVRGVSKTATLVEPDLDFIREIKQAGGDTLKKCFQCATCSVVCALSPDQKPYPRKEMIYAQWGLKERLLNSVDVWLCHYCNDCSAYCPRGARPGDALRAIRAASFRHFSLFGIMGKIVGEAKYLPVMVGIPVLLFLAVLSFTGHLHIPEGEIEFRKFFPLLYVDIIFIAMTVLALVSIGAGALRFLQGIHENAMREGYAENRVLEVRDYVKSLVSVIPTILLHTKFKLCNTNRDRYLAHLLVLFGFVGLFVVTNIGFLGLYIVRSDFLAPPYPFANPVKLLALVAGLALLVGIILVTFNRMKAKAAESRTSYLDTMLIVAITATVATGFLSWLGRVWLEAAGFAYTVYFLHLVCVFYIIAYLPYSKLAHLVYRTVAMGYAAYIDRPFGVEVVAPAPAVPAPEPAEAEKVPEAEATEAAEAPAESEEEKAEEEGEEKKE